MRNAMIALLAPGSPRLTRTPAGYRLAGEHRFLPNQFFMVFAK